MPISINSQKLSQALLGSGSVTVTSEQGMRRAAVLILRAYKYFISPLLPPSCRFTPTCSEYAIEAISTYGIFKGTRLTVWRLMRCHPFCEGGYDPVDRISGV